MFVPPNWVGLAAVGLLGIVDPGFWVLGAGLELGYLLLLSTNERFRRTVTARDAVRVARRLGQRASAARSPRSTTTIGGATRRSRTRCRSILDLQSTSGAAAPVGLETQQEGLGRLDVDVPAAAVARTRDQQGARRGRRCRICRDRSRRSSAASTTEHAQTTSCAAASKGRWRSSRQRIDRRGEAERQLAFIDAELARIEQQVELIREQAALSTDPELLSRRIDEIAATLGGTSQWIRDQQQVYGAMEDLLTEPPPLDRVGPRAKERE